MGHYGLPYFFLLDCGPLKNPENGNVSTPGGIGYGQVGEYTCNVGYFLVGHKKRQCLDTGSWSGSPPTCQIYGKAKSFN